MKHALLVLLCSIGLLRSQAADEPLIPNALNSLLPKIRAGMTIREVEAVLATVYPNVKGAMSNWSGQTGYIDYQLDERFSLSVSSITRDRQQVVHNNLLFYLTDRPAKHRVDIKSYFWESPAQKNTEFLK